MENLKNQSNGNMGGTPNILSPPIQSPNEMATDEDAIERKKVYNIINLKLICEIRFLI